MTGTKKVVLFLFGGLTVALGTGYFLGVAYFQTHFKPGTTINGYHCSLKTVDDACDILTREVESYTLAINTRNNGIESISAEDAAMEFVGRDVLIDLINHQDYILWFIPETKDTTLSIDCYDIDEEKMKSAISELKCMTDMVKAEPAHIVETDDYYQVSPNIKGTELDSEKTLKTIETALRQSKKEVSLEDAGCYIDVELNNEDSLQEKCEILNSIQDTIITYDFGDRTEKINFKTIKEKFLDEEYNLSIDNIKQYITELASKYDTVNTRRMFVTYDDRSVLVQSGDYGWTLDVDKTAENLLNLVLNDIIDVVEPIYKQKAMSRDSNDIGYSYLEIDKNQKVAVLYVDGEPIVKTNIQMNGNVSDGVYNVKEKKEEIDGLKYAVSFGDSYIYKYDSDSNISGSGDLSLISTNSVRHGCIAVDETNVSSIFSIISDGWPVIIY